MAKFTVDTHLFRELGELLVGRDSTALIELIKNAYDADATEVIVHGEQLDDPDMGYILVKDNGVGMNTDEFGNGFLRVASRLKEHGYRCSPLFGRRYTGAKGIGRLAAHKLARKLEINSVRHGSESQMPREALHAIIDWDRIERHETLDELDESEAIVVQRESAEGDASSGTTLVLSRLRRPWTPSERARFFAEIQSFEPPAFLRAPLPASVIEQNLLFETPVVQGESIDGQVSGSPFSVRLEGEFTAGENYWALVAEVAAWVLEIQALPGNGEVQFAIAPTKKTQKDNPDARGLNYSVPHPDPKQGPYFDARILVREGVLQGSRDLRTWASGVSGVRVFLEGFRVLPYGERQDDWLSIDADYTRRPRQLAVFREPDLGVGWDDRDVGLNRLPNNNYFGAVFLTQERCPNLRVLVNREGFIPEAGFDNLVRLVRTGVDLCTRVRAAAGYVRRRERREQRQEAIARSSQKGARKAEGAVDSNVDVPELPHRLRDAVQFMERARDRLSEGNAPEAENAVGAAMREIDVAAGLAADLWSERSLLYVLASVGTQMAAFVHEINALLGLAQSIEHGLGRLREEAELSREYRARLSQALLVVTELKRGLELQSSYFTDIETPDARRRRSRQPLSERFEAAVRLVQHQARRRGIEITNQISPILRTPPMFSAEIVAVFTNLLTNAVKAAGSEGCIRATATGVGDQVRVRIQNSGEPVNLADAERWFKPFESTTLDVDPVLGQGMGLGLTITRNILEKYGAFIGFVEADDPFTTAVEVTLPVRS